MTPNSTEPLPSANIFFLLSHCAIIVQVAVINFSKAYSNYHSPVSVSVNNSSLVVGMTTPHDIIMTDRVIETQVVSIAMYLVVKIIVNHK